MRDSRARGRDGNGRGSATVEFALVLPILMVVTLAILQVGLLARDQLLVVHSARAGARQASISSDDAVVRLAVEGAAPLDPRRLDVVVERAGVQGGPVAVHVRYAAAIEVPLVEWLFPPSVPLSARSVLRQEFP